MQGMVSKGVEPLVVQGLGALWTNCKRFFSAFGKVHDVPLLASNGIPQGCALSVMACNTLVEGWLKAIHDEGGGGRAYIDDRYVTASDKEQLERSATAGFEWERRNGWRTNIKKTTLVSLPRMKEEEMVGGRVITKVDTLQSLGTEIPLHGHARVELPRKRHENASCALSRVAALKLPTHVMQQIVEIVIIPKTCYHVQTRPLQDYWCERLRRAINAAVGLRHRGHCYEVVASLFRRPHRYDPKSASIYCHLVSVLRILRRQEEALGKWRRIHDQIFLIPPSQGVRLEFGRPTCVRLASMNPYLIRSDIEPRIPPAPGMARSGGRWRTSCVMRSGFVSSSGRLSKGATFRGPLPWIMS